MTTNTKIRTEDVLEILDFKIKASSDHPQIDVLTGEDYSSVLAKIAARSPTMDEKNALDNTAIAPSATNPYVTQDELTASLEGAIPWKTIGLIGSGADFTGTVADDETAFVNAFATAPTDLWFYVKPGTYTFTTPVTVPAGVRLVGGITSETILLSNTTGTLVVEDNVYVSFLTIATNAAGETAVDASGTTDVELKNCLVTATATGLSINIDNSDRVCISDCALMADLSGTNVTNATLVYLYADVPGAYGVNLTTPTSVVMWGSVFVAGTPLITSGTNIRIIGNHFANGFTNTYLSSMLITSPAQIDTINDAITYAGTLKNNWALRFTTTTGALPNPLLVATTYYIVNLTPTTFQLSLTPNGSPIDLITVGSGVHTASLNPSILLRANTPSSNNNEDESLTYLLQYLGSPGALVATPSYSSNFAGPQAQDLTARASAIDLLLQWIYEERNFSLIAESEPMVVTWAPATATLSTDGGMLLVSAHRDAVWKLPQIIPVVIPAGSFLYYIVDRSLTTSDITLTQYIAPLGSIPIDTNPPTGTPDNRQIWTLAYNYGGTLWWRGGGGSRFPSTNNYPGEYFVDGTSKSLLTYIGAEDYNDPHPTYTHNFAGIQGESLTTRLGKTDALIQRLFEQTNLSYYMSSGGYFGSDTGEAYDLILTGTLSFKLGHIAGTITVAPQSWTIPDGSLLYFTWDPTAPGVASSTVATVVPLPNDYPANVKYFVAAIRVGSFIYLWDGTRLPMRGGRWPLFSPTRSILPTASATALLTAGYQVVNNATWTTITGTKHFMWENLAVVTSTGISPTRNSLVNQTAPSTGLTDIADGQGLVVTHTWNSGSGGAQNVDIQKVTLPLTATLEQNQFLWVQNRGGYLLFTGEF